MRKKVGVVWKLPLSETSRLLATSRAREPALGRLGAVDRDVELRVVEVLLDAQVDQAGHLAELVQHLVGDPAIALDVGALDLHVDRRGQAEVEDLRDDVGGQEVEGHAGKLLRQRSAAAPGRSRRWGDALAFSETRMSASAAPITPGRAVHPVDGAVGQADVVEDHVQLAGGDLAPDRRLDQIAQARGLLDAGAGLGPQVQDELPAVGVGEEVLAEPRSEQEGGQTDDQEDRNEDRSAGRRAR